MIPTISTFIPSMLATLLLLLMTSPPTLWLGEQRRGARSRK